MPTNPAKIFTSHKPVFLNVAQVCEADGYLRFGIDPVKVDELLSLIMKAIEGYKADTVVTAIGIAFYLVTRRFEFKFPSYIQFISNFVHRGGDEKLATHAFERMLACLYKDHLTRFEKVVFNKGIPMPKNMNKKN